MKRLHVVGTSGSGKTTLGAAIGRTLGIPHVEMDALHWAPNWTEVGYEVMRARVDQATSGEAWVIDGNYFRQRDLIWSRADTVVWLDYPIWTVMWQVTRRSLTRLASREELWHGNHESWRMTFLSKDSILLGALTSHWTNKRRYPALLADPVWSHLTFVRLRSPRQTRSWLKQLPASDL